MSQENENEVYVDHDKNRHPAVDSAVDKLAEMPAFKPADVPLQESRATVSQLFNRQRPLHEILGSGKVADVILWRRRNLTVSILLVGTVVWYMFECTGYTLLSLVANVLLLLITILFVWSNAAVILKRPPPSVPELEVSEESVNKISTILMAKINHGFKLSRELVLGKDFKLFLKVASALWILSTVGAWFNFFTLVYICLLVILTVPAFYDKYQNHIDRYSGIAKKETRKQYEKFDAHVLSKIPRGFSKEKKVL
uniref:Reticulon-like protein n=1 Tax=Araucaria cunninghamii TaxID=56994 RepID=A0A0D6R0N7_ARACU